MVRMLTTLAILAIFAASPANEYALANSHRQGIPQQDWGYTYYLTTSGVSEEHRECLETSMKFVLPSLSLNPLVDSQIPQRVFTEDKEGNAVVTNLWMIDTRSYGWEKSFPSLLKRHYPYGIYGSYSLVVRADWFLPFATDASENGAYYDLVFGQRFKTRDEFVKLLQISSDPKYTFGLIEGKSGVAVAKKRWIESRPIPRGYAWLTRDSAKITFKTDPVEHPTGDFKHDAEEWIIGVPKISSATGTRGTLQVYFLSNGKGQTQDKAPANIVTDNTRIRYGATEIRNGISCIACHAAGINQPTVNEFRRLIDNGVDVYAKKGIQQQLEAFHLTDTAKEIARNQEDFRDIIELCTQTTTDEAVDCYTDSIQLYDSDVTLEQAALECGSTPNELKLALAYGSNNGDYPARVAELAHGQAIPRSLFEEYFSLVYNSLKVWRTRQ